MTKLREGIWAFLFLPVLIFLALFNTGTMYIEGILQHEPRPLTLILVQELTAVLSVSVILVPLVILGMKLLIRRDNWFYMIPIHAALYLLSAWCMTTLIYSTRETLYPLLGLKLDLPSVAARYWMESRLQLLGYGLCMVSVHLTAAWREREQRERDLAEMRLKATLLATQADRAQLAALRAQLQPHFLFNALNVISAVIYEDVERADKLIADLGDLLRLAMAHSQANTVPLRHELNFLERYLAVMKARFQDRLVPCWQVDEAALDWGVPYLILQPLVENAIKHMDTQQTGPVEIQIRAGQDGDQLLLEVADNGTGLTQTAAAGADASAASGLGLANIRERLATQYGDKARLTLENRAEGGVLARISLPCEAAEAELN